MKTINSKGDSAQLKNSMLKLINDRQVMHRSELELLEKIFNFQFESKELIHAVKELDIPHRPSCPEFPDWYGLSWTACTSLDEK